MLQGRLAQRKRDKTENGERRTYAGSDWGAALLVAFGTAVTHDARHPVLARTLTSGLVARFARRPHRMAFACCGIDKVQRE